MTKRIELGDLVRDTVTKFEGVVIVEMQWLHGCRRLGVQPQKLTKEGKTAGYESFDEGQLVLLKKAVAPSTAATVAPTALPPRDATGGPSLGRDPERR